EVNPQACIFLGRRRDCDRLTTNLYLGRVLGDLHERVFVEPGPFLDGVNEARLVVGIIREIVLVGLSVDVALGWVAVKEAAGKGVDVVVGKASSRRVTENLDDDGPVFLGAIQGQPGG